jgi:hypothetical protein
MTAMWIDLDEAIQIYARMLRSRLGSAGAAKAALEKADDLRAKGDWSGVKVWEAVAANVARTAGP